jgi:hypothetical protein
MILGDAFQGILTSETRCLNCETVTSKDEDFFDLSIDVEQVPILKIFAAQLGGEIPGWIMARSLVHNKKSL